MNIILAMVIAGALSGLGGGLLYLAGSGKHIEILEVLADEGFTGMSVALLGLSMALDIFYITIPFVQYLLLILQKVDSIYSSLISPLKLLISLLQSLFTLVRLLFYSKRLSNTL